MLRYLHAHRLDTEVSGFAEGGGTTLIGCMAQWEACMEGTTQAKSRIRKGLFSSHFLLDITPQTKQSSSH